MDDQSQVSHSFNSQNDSQQPLGGLGTPPVDNSSPVIDKPDPAFTPSIDSPRPSTPSSTSDESTDLMDIKKQALSQLSPLVKNLDQNPEERFKTTMMMIQAGDDQNLIKDAYAAAQEITDEKTKAQALLDIVNEINYFTQRSESE